MSVASTAEPWRHPAIIFEKRLKAVGHILADKPACF